MKSYLQNQRALSICQRNRDYSEHPDFFRHDDDDEPREDNEADEADEANLFTGREE